MGLSIMRSKGIPVMMDFIPQWPVRSGRHYWNVMLDNRGKNVVFLATESDPGMPHKVEEKLGKVYRQTYAIRIYAHFRCGNRSSLFGEML